MRLQNSGVQGRLDPLYVADGTITVGGTAQRVLAASISRSHLLIQNLSAGSLYMEHGCGRAVATVSGGVVTAIAVTNAGAGFSYAPTVYIQGGGGKDGPDGNSAYLGLNQPGAASPTAAATAHCVMTGAAPNMSIASIVVDSGGAHYLCAPYVYLAPSALDPYGYTVPGAGSGIYLPAGGQPLIWNGTVCFTEAISIWGATTGLAYCVRWMD